MINWTYTYQTLHYILLCSFRIWQHGMNNCPYTYIIFSSSCVFRRYYMICTKPLLWHDNRLLYCLTLSVMHFVWAWLQENEYTVCPNFSASVYLRHSFNSTEKLIICLYLPIYMSQGIVEGVLPYLYNGNTCIVCGVSQWWLPKSIFCMETV